MNCAPTPPRRAPSPSLPLRSAQGFGSGSGQGSGQAFNRRVAPNVEYTHLTLSVDNVSPLCYDLASASHHPLFC